MNGTAPKIEIFKPFGEAFELTKRILFQPFDFKKWLVMGFAAFLASFSGGFQSSINPFSNWNAREDRREIAKSLSEFGPVDQLEWWVIGLIVIGIVLVLALIVVLMWIGARGRFIFTDCIVHNRGAIVAPWKEFRAQGNSFFLFSLLVGLVIILCVIVAVLPLILPRILSGDHSTPGAGFWICFGVVMLLILVVSLGWALISHLMVPIMYRQRCRAAEAFGKTVRLVTASPGPIVLCLLFLLVLGLAAVMISCLATCVTCCIAAIPYVGAVILLPISVTLYGFVLLFLRQFGSEYDVWAGLVEAASSPPSLPPPIQT